ncbi:MAG: phosphoribosyltransferase family protein [Armatimonadota bacterium]|nr:phosphoribosyltransferase family protein [Armatimonadota bacterium]
MIGEDACPEDVIELPELRDRVGVFEGREEAGHVLAGMVEHLQESDALVLGVPAGGVPVAAALADDLGLELDVAVVSKITLPWNPEAGYGAVAFDGSVRINEPLVGRLGLGDEDVRRGIEATREKVQRRVRELRGERPLPDISGRTVILADDGLASGFTMLTAAQAVRENAPEQVVVAVPTAHMDAVRRVVDEVDCIYCANLRGGLRFAVAAAYRHWYDVSLDEVIALLEEHRAG